jgi:hypothetical protein
MGKYVQLSMVKTRNVFPVSDYSFEQTSKIKITNLKL